MNKKDIIIYEYDDLPEYPYDGKYRKIDIPILKYITNRIRKTIEYKNFITYMKKTMNINKCSFYKDYSMEKGFTIELHHAPLTLFDYVEVVANKFYSLPEREDDPYIYPWEVEEEVNILHYEFKVGLVPLNPTAHKLVHSDVLKVIPNMIEGNYRHFISEYKEYITDDIKTKLNEFDELAKLDPDKIPNIVKYKPVLISNLKFKSLGGIKLEKMIVDKLKERFEKSQNLIDKKEGEI